MKTVEQLNDHWDARPTQRAPVGMSMAEYARKHDKQKPRTPMVKRCGPEATLQHWSSIKEALRCYGPMTKKEAARLTGIKLHTVNGNMAKMHAAGVIERTGEAHQYGLTE